MKAAKSYRDNSLAGWFGQHPVKVRPWACGPAILVVVQRWRRREVHRQVLESRQDIFGPEQGINDPGRTEPGEARTERLVGNLDSKYRVGIQRIRSGAVLPQIVHAI